jgi:hypothetical protein
MQGIRNDHFKTYNTIHTYTETTTWISNSRATKVKIRYKIMVIFFGFCTSLCDFVSLQKQFGSLKGAEGRALLVLNHLKIGKGKYTNRNASQ